MLLNTLRSFRKKRGSVSEFDQFLSEGLRCFQEKTFAEVDLLEMMETQAIWHQHTTNGFCLKVMPESLNALHNDKGFYHEVFVV